jgi:hypothetical protein
VRISQHGAGAFGWNICREVDSVELDRSTRQFSTRLEALLDSAHAAATLNFAIVEPSSVDGEDINGSE